MCVGGGKWVGGEETGEVCGEGVERESGSSCGRYRGRVWLGGRCVEGK